MKVQCVLLTVFFLGTAMFGEQRGCVAVEHADSSTEQLTDNDRIGTVAQEIYFGHQSVGADILAGVRHFIAKMRTDLQVTPLGEKGRKQGVSTIYHSRIGRNTEAETKINAFAEVLRSGLGQRLDLALFKFCYVDINSDTDVNKLFKRYAETLDALKEEFPDLVLAHVTVPLTAQQTGIKAWIKWLLRRPLRGYKENIARNRFNRLLKQAYQDLDPIFDLARAESTYPDGSRCTFVKNGRNFFSLVPEYTSDGGHLNESGQKIIGRKFLDFLESIRH